MFSWLLTLTCLHLAPARPYLCSKTLEAASVQYGVKPVIEQIQHHSEVVARKWVKQNVPSNLTYAATTAYTLGVQKRFQINLAGGPLGSRIEIDGAQNGAVLRLVWTF